MRWTFYCKCALYLWIYKVYVPIDAEVWHSSTKHCQKLITVGLCTLLCSIVCPI